MLSPLCAVLLAAAWSQDFQVELSAASVPFGAPFEVTVRRQVPLGEVFGEFDTARLAPLELELVDVRREVDRDRRREDLVFAARAFALGELQLESDPRVTLQVTSALQADDDGRMELDFEPIGPPRDPRWRWWAGLLALLALALAFWQRHRGAATVVQQPPEPPPPPDPRGEALLALARLGQATDEEGRQREVAQAADVVRGAMGALWQVPAGPSTSSELLAHLKRARAPAETRAELAELLRDADRVKFALAPTDTPTRDRFLAAARRVLHREDPHAGGTP